MTSFIRALIVLLLTYEARLILRKYRPRIVAVVGSVGKTSAKDAIYAALAQRFFVRKSEKSFNSEVGIPLTILGSPTGWRNPVRWLQTLFDGLVLLIVPHKYPEWLVLEVGADRPGDIAKVAAWLPVDIAVITRLPDVPVHVEFFDSPQEVIEEKAQILKAIRPGGWFIGNADDPEVMALRSRTQAQILTFGSGASADIRACDFSLFAPAHAFPDGVRATLDCDGPSVPLTIVGTVGAHTLLSALAGYSVGKVLGVDPHAMGRALSEHTPPPGRMRLIAGVKETLLIDDTYNASPTAMIAALDGLALVTTARRKIAIFGDMLELGRYSASQHREVGVHAARVCDILVTVGFRARDIAEGALSAGMHEAAILQFEDSTVAGKEVERFLQSGDCVLIKGSQSMRMERAVEELMAEPQHASELLVRQEREWKKNR